MTSGESEKKATEPGSEILAAKVTVEGTPDSAPDETVLRKLKSGEFRIVSNDEYFGYSKEEMESLKNPRREVWMLETSYSQIQKRFGAPVNGPSGDDKSVCDWTIRIDNTLIDIYDYKINKAYYKDGRGMEPSEIMSDTVISWHLKANPGAAAAIKRFFKD